MEPDISLVLLVTMITTLMLIGVTIFLFYVFYSSKAKLQEKNNRLESEVSKSKIEIREEFMRYIGKELHDNVGQLLSTAKLQMHMSPHKADLSDSIDLVGESINEIRNISKRMDPDAVNNMGLVDSCRREIQRIDRINEMKATVEVSGEEFSIDPKDEIILFRIVQESLNNLIKHANAAIVSLTLHYDSQKLFITLTDDGIGFTIAEVQKEGSGLTNMKQRAEIIDAEFLIQSEINKGTTTTIVYPK